MLALKVSLNNKKLCIAGPDSLGVISVITNLTRSKHPDDGADKPAGVDDIDLSIGGLFTPSDEPGWFVDWAKKNLKLGDKITIEVVDVEEADPPKTKKLYNAQIMENIRKRMEKRRKRYG